MGQGFSLFNNDDINLNAYKKNNISSTIPYANKLYSDATRLATTLNRNQFSMWDELPPANMKNYKMYQQSAEVENDNNFSDTSPFITTDVYKNLVNEQLGGNFDDSTSSTSASSSSSSTSDKKKKAHKKSKESTEDSVFSGKYEKHPVKKNAKKTGKKTGRKPVYEDEDEEEEDEEEEEEDEDDEDEDYNGYSGVSSNVISNSDDSNNTYESSSAHSDGIDSNSNSNTNITTVSAKYYRNHSAMSDSINTSDINIISVEN
jgi:hypothetical protein